MHCLYDLSEELLCREVEKLYDHCQWVIDAGGDHVIIIIIIIFWFTVAQWASSLKPVVRYTHACNRNNKDSLKFLKEVFEYEGSIND